MEKTKGGFVMLTMKALREGIRLSLAQFVVYVRYSVSQDMTDINRYAEDFYCGLLNKAFGWKLHNLNQDNRNQPAIDLADDTNKIAVQVTSSTDRGKVTGTLKRFFAENLDQQYQRLLMLVIGEEDPFSKAFTLERGFDFDPQRDIWDTPRLLGKLEGITDLDKLRKICDYLQDQLGGYPFPRPLTPDLPLRTALEGDAFVGRGEELAEIDRRFRSERVLFLTGLGGMGKTELAVRYAREFVEKRGHRAFLVLFRGDLRETLLNNVAPEIPNLDTRNLTEREIYEKTLEALNRCGHDALLILDNADQANLMDLRIDLGALALRVLVTTRQGVEWAVDVDQLHREELYRLFVQHEAQIKREEMDALINAVDGHTLTVDLMARALRPGFRAATVEKLLKNLSDSSVKRVRSAYLGRSNQARINEHLQAIFRVVELSNKEQSLLYFATLLPENGMDPELFLLLFEENLADELEDLIQGGWLLWRDDLLRIHPVIRLVCIEKFKPTDEESEPRLNCLLAWYIDSSYEMERYEQVAETFAKAGELLADTKKWNEHAIEILRKLNQEQRDREDFKNALRYSLRMMHLLEKQEGIGMVEGRSGLAESYARVSSDYRSMGYDREANEYNAKAIKLRGFDSLIKANIDLLTGISL